MGIEGCTSGRNWRRRDECRVRTSIRSACHTGLLFRSFLPSLLTWRLYPGHAAAAFAISVTKRHESRLFQSRPAMQQGRRSRTS